MTAVLVSADACLGCGACLLTCPEHALRPAPAAPVVLGTRCTGCLECVEVCPADAIDPQPLTRPSLGRSG